MASLEEELASHRRQDAIYRELHRHQSEVVSAADDLKRYVTTHVWRVPMGGVFPQVRDLRLQVQGPLHA